MAHFTRLFLVLLITASSVISYAEESPAPEKHVTDLIDEKVGPVADFADKIVFWGFPVEVDGVEQRIPIILILLGGTAVFLTIFFKFINIRGFMTSVRTVRGKYSDPDAPGQITHFQALTAALSATVGLGNISGVAIAIGLGGPGATFWMIVLGFCGMTTKFAECTLGVKYRRIDSDGKAHGGAMYYLQDGLKSLGLAPVGIVLAILFALFVIGGAFGAGNMYQSNQAFSQFAETWVDLETDKEVATAKLIFGGTFAVLVGMVIIGGIVWIARVTSFLVPFMCGTYVLAALVIIFANIGDVIPAIETIFKSAFSSTAISGGIIGVLIQGIKRAAFSNEAGVGSAPIAHSAVKTNRPASEGMVALIEPFVDTVVVCTITALVVVITGTWKVNGEINAEGINIVNAAGSITEVVQPIDKGQFVHTGLSKKIGEGDESKEWTKVIGLISPDGRTEETVTGWVRSDTITDKKGIPVTSLAFEGTISWFPKILSIAVMLFAFSTMISWSYYGEQGVIYLFRLMGAKTARIPVLIYKLVFCLLIIVGASASLGNILKLSDAMVFAMAIPNLIGLYLLLPVVKREAASYLAHVKEVDAGKK